MTTHDEAHREWNAETDAIMAGREVTHYCRADCPPTWRCPHAPECEERFDTLDALNEHIDTTRHACCQVPPPAHDGGAS